jgi:hypothetical protein
MILQRLYSLILPNPGVQIVSYNISFYTILNYAYTDACVMLL